MSDLATAPQTGASEASTPAPASTPAAETTSAPAADKGSDKGAERLSSRDAIRKAMDTVNSRPPNETEKAVAALREGAGADERLEAERAANAEKGETTSEASERAKAGWETRRANEAKAKEAEAAPVAKAAEQPVAKVEAPKPEVATESKFKEPPSRFAPATKAEWDKVPEAIRAEIDRSHKELEQGLSKYKGDAEKFAQLADFEKMANEHYKLPLKDVIQNYADADRLLGQDILAGLEQIVGPHGYSLRQIAEHVMGQPEDATFNNETVQLKSEVTALKRELAEMRNGLTTNQKSEAERRTASIQKQVEDYAKSNPRFDELFADAEMFLASPKFEKTGDALADLKKAFEKAERLNPAPSLSPPAPDIPAPDRAAQTRAGQASVTGAPGAGSNPARKPVPQTNRDAIRQAFSSLGLPQS